jgi:hypothetical protein
MQRMKQLARSAVYWPNMDEQINDACRQCTSCMEHSNKPSKPENHPWIVPEKPWSRIHIDHAINFMGSNWLVVTDAYSKYPCIHQVSSTSTKATTLLLEDDFSHFGYPHTIVSDNAPNFTSQEFQEWCRERGIIHLTGAPYHPATNGAAERLVQTFKQAIRKSSLPLREAVQEFLIQYRRTPLTSGYSPSELLNGRQIRARIDTLVPSPAHISQGLQTATLPKTAHNSAEFHPGSPCYALYCGPRATEDPKWIPGIIVKVRGTRNFEVKLLPHGPIWRRHLEQLKPRVEDTDTDPPLDIQTSQPEDPVHQDTTMATQDGPDVISHEPDAIIAPQPPGPPSPAYGPGNPRRSKRQRKPRQPYDM